MGKNGAKEVLHSIKQKQVVKSKKKKEREGHSNNARTNF